MNLAQKQFSLKRSVKAISCYQFYNRCGYQQEAALPDFYAPGDAKVIFVRVLPGE